MCSKFSDIVAMKSISILSIFFLATATLNAAADVSVSGGGNYNPKVTLNKSTLSVDITMRFADVKVKSEQQLTVTPKIESDNNSLALPVVTVTGRRRSIRDARDGVTPSGYASYRAGKVPDSISYHVDVPLSEWMLDSKLLISDSLTGCNCSPLTGGSLLLADIDLKPRTFAPEYVYAESIDFGGSEKIRQAAGHAFIDFPVNQTKIYSDYRRNPAELAAIRDTIELIKRDPDYTITALSLKGYASPEGSYSVNDRLAKGRTESLCNYIRNIYSFPDSLISLQWDAEDWAGLTDWVRNSDIENRDAILNICTDTQYDGDDDRREWILKTRFPKQYRMLLADVYPGLRHTDYMVRYTVRSFTSVEEIARVMKEAPYKLSLREMYMFAKTLTPGTPEYTDLYETAVRLYPEAPVANINAANTAMQAGELLRAERYLDRAGDSPEAVYARGILAALQADYKTAESLFEMAEKAGIAKAADARCQIVEIVKRLPKE